MIVWKGWKFNADAEKCYRELETLGDSYTPQQIVDFAKNPETELHKCFEWDDTKAAENWRKQQARYVCCSISIVTDETEQKQTAYRLIQHNTDKQSYQNVVVTVRNRDQYSELLQMAKKELNSFKERYRSIVELESVIDEIERFLK